MTYIIAEVGGNHDGDINQAITLIEEAANAGANAVKFQSYKAENLVLPTAAALPQAQRAGYSTQYQRFKDLEFSPKEWDRLIEVCRSNNIDFLTTPFDLEALAFFKDKMKYIKVSSGDLTYHRLLRAIAETGKPVILSTGMARYDEISDGGRFFDPNILTVCHCTSIYPCPDVAANLSVIPELQRLYSSVGYSDHTVGVEASMIAMSMGITVLEKHFTMDSTKDYGDHPLSIEPYELSYLVETSKRISQMMGDLKPHPDEPRRAMRRGAYAKHPIKVGQIITENDIIELRPQKGRRPDAFIGTRAIKDYEELECLI